MAELHYALQPFFATDGPYGHTASETFGRIGREHSEEKSLQRPPCESQPAGFRSEAPF